MIWRVIFSGEWNAITGHQSTRGCLGLRTLRLVTPLQDNIKALQRPRVSLPLPQMNFSYPKISIFSYILQPQTHTISHLIILPQ